MMTPGAPAVEPRAALTPCPSWCTRDHSRTDLVPAHIGDRAVIGGFRARPYDEITARAAHVNPGYGDPKVWLDATRAGAQAEAPYAWLDPETAVTVARLAEMLAGATAAQHRALAAALRDAAALITAGGAR